VTDRPVHIFDAVTLEILWSRLIAIVDEAATAMVRTAFSTIVRESNDYSVVLTDASGESVAENTGGIPSFVGILPRTIRHMLQQRPARRWRRGDVMITNDPWLATGHLPDVTMVSPVFHGDRLVAFSGSIAHLPDIGGGLWSADCQEIYEEGLRIPPMRLWVRKRPNTTLVSLIEANTRVPQQVMGDIYAQAAAHDVCYRRVNEFLTDTGLQDLTALGLEVKTRAEMAMRKAIAAVPDGIYRGRLVADGFEEPLILEAEITVKGDEIRVDYTGTSPQVARGTNCVYNYTQAYTAYPIKCALDPYTPRNEGSYRPVVVHAPEGSILNPRFPAAVGARHLTGHLLAGVVYQALAACIPARVLADCGSAPSMRAVFSGRRPDGRQFSAIVFASGGMGASATQDGLSTTPFPTNVGVGSIEALEHSTPLLIWKKEFRADSGGAGRFRGGLGQELQLEVRSAGQFRVALLAERSKYPPIGLLGGAPGALSEIFLRGGIRPGPKSRFNLDPGELMTLRYAGGGGYGPPSGRELRRIQDDVRSGLVTEKAAEEVYGSAWAEPSMMQEKAGKA
jgi:N-methylhydantoinase B